MKGRKFPQALRFHTDYLLQLLWQINDLISISPLAQSTKIVIKDDGAQKLFTAKSPCGGVLIFIYLHDVSAA